MFQNRLKKAAALLLTLALLIALTGMGLRSAEPLPADGAAPRLDGAEEDFDPLGEASEPEPEPFVPEDPLEAEPDPEPEPVYDPDPDPLSADVSSEEEPEPSAGEWYEIIGEVGPEYDVDSVEGLEEAVFNFTFQVDTLWQWAGDTMIFPVRNGATLIAAVNTIASLGEGNYIIAFAADVTMPVGSVPLVFGCGHTTILGCGHTLHMQPGDGTETCIVVEGEDTSLSLGTELLEDGLTILGRVPEDGGCYPSLITVRGGTLDIHDGVTITGHRSGRDGGALRVEGGVVSMYGGRISDCSVAGEGSVRGGGVYVRWGGRFYLYGGVVSDCCAISTNGVSYGGGIAAEGDPEKGALSFENAPLQLLGGRITGCAANIGGGVSLDAFPGKVVLGGVSIDRNACFGCGASAAGGLWYAAADGFALYIFDSCRINSNVFCPVGTYLTGPEEEDGAEETGVSFRRLREADASVEPSDLSVPATNGAEDPACLRVGELGDARIGLIADPDAMAISGGWIYVTSGFADGNPEKEIQDVFFSDSQDQDLSGFYEVILRAN